MDLNVQITHRRALDPRLSRLLTPDTGGELFYLQDMEQDEENYVRRLLVERDDKLVPVAEISYGEDLNLNFRRSPDGKRLAITFDVRRPDDGNWRSDDFGYIIHDQSRR